jgi:hypothetical protein
VKPGFTGEEFQIDPILALDLDAEPQFRAGGIGADR